MKIQKIIEKRSSNLLRKSGVNEDASGKYAIIYEDDLKETIQESIDEVLEEALKDLWNENRDTVGYMTIPGWLSKYNVISKKETKSER